MMPSGPISQPMGPNGSQSGGWQAQGTFDSGPFKQLPAHIAQKLNDYGYVPRRLTVVNPADMTTLDRRERQLLLLVDNRRTIADLIRLTRRNDDELRYILAHLITLGLVE